MMKSVMVFKQQATRRKWHLVRLIVVVLSIIGMYIVVTPKMPKFSNHLEIHFQQFISLPDRLSERVNAFNINKKPLLNRNRMYVNMTSKHGLSNKQMGFLSHCMKETRTKLLRNISSVLYDQQNEEFQAHVRVRCSSEHECKHTVLLGRVQVNVEEVPTISLQTLESLKDLKRGGWWHPEGCLPERNVAIIIPFKNRESQLAIFLRHYHPIFQRQHLHYRIFVVEQVDQHPFNRGKLMNVGFQEALKYFPFDCFVFHDVDLLLEDDRLIYQCQSSPQHLSVGLDKYNYRLLYEELFGGIEMFTTEHYKLVNGFSNSFWGWGAEDDNLYRRLRWKSLSLWRPSVHIARYTMVKHQDLEGYASMSRFDIRKESYTHFATDGLINLQYEVKNTLQEYACTRIQVDLRKDRDKMFGVKEFPK